MASKSAMIRWIRRSTRARPQARAWDFTVTELASSPPIGPFAGMAHNSAVSAMPPLVPPVLRVAPQEDPNAKVRAVSARLNAQSGAAHSVSRPRVAHRFH
jgi:hypothetical protein